GGVFRKALHEVEIRFLEHVGRIEAAIQTAVESQANHLSQPFSVEIEQPGQRLCVAGRGPAKQFIHRTRVTGHDCPHIAITGRTSPSSTRWQRKGLDFLMATTAQKPAAAWAGILLALSVIAQFSEQRRSGGQAFALRSTIAERLNRKP